jgi:CsoR family transcriptional regulator, copper-sensing transcriptional repressor
MTVAARLEQVPRGPGWTAVRQSEAGSLAAMDDDAAAPSRGSTDQRSAPSTRRSDEEHQDRADRLAERIAIPVLIAALASVPAVFLSLFDDPYQTLGEGLNTLSGGVLIAETVVLLAVSENRWSWVKRNKWLVLLALAIIPAIVFAVGPVQLLRLLRIAGALRIIRVKRIFKAGKIVRERAGLNKTWERVIGVGVTVLCAAFVAVMLADPTATRELSRFGSESQDALSNVVNRLGWIGIAVAGLILAGATYIVWSNRRQSDGDTGDDEAAGNDARGDGEAAGNDRREAAD